MDFHLTYHNFRHQAKSFSSTPAPSAAGCCCCFFSCFSLSIYIYSVLKLEFIWSQMQMQKALGVKLCFFFHPLMGSENGWKIHRCHQCSHGGVESIPQLKSYGGVESVFRILFQAIANFQMRNKKLNVCFCYRIEKFVLCILFFGGSLNSKRLKFFGVFTHWINEKWFTRHTCEWDGTYKARNVIKNADVSINELGLTIKSN